MTEQNFTNEQLRQRVEELEHGLARLSAQRSALQRALHHFCPDHPLLTSPALRGAIGRAGLQTLHASNNWDAVRKAGLDYPLYTPSVQFSKITMMHMSSMRAMGATGIDETAVRHLDPPDGKLSSMPNTSE